MNNEACYAVWAPDGIGWSQWAKPVLFTQMQQAPPAGGEALECAACDVSWAPRARDNTAVIVDLPAAQSTITGLALAREGYRPVPLYNTSLNRDAIVDASGIARFLAAGAAWLGGEKIAPDAPPAFLLDSRRMKPQTLPAPGKFDNRWVVFPQDFPSAMYLMSRGIGTVLVIADASEPLDDLSHVLLRWQRAGIRITVVSPTVGDRTRDVVVKEPSRFRRAWYRAVALMGLRRNNVGGFGGEIPTPSSGGSGFS